MRTLTFILVMLFINSSSAQSTSTKVLVKDVKAANVINGAILLDTNSIPGPDELLKLPSALTVASCNVGLASKGYVVRFPYGKTSTGKFPKEALDIIKMAKPGDELIFEDIYVMKGDKKLRLADKSILVK